MFTFERASLFIYCFLYLFNKIFKCCLCVGNNGLKVGCFALFAGLLMWFIKGVRKESKGSPGSEI